MKIFNLLPIFFMTSFFEVSEANHLTVPTKKSTVSTERYICCDVPDKEEVFETLESSAKNACALEGKDLFHFDKPIYHCRSSCYVVWWTSEYECVLK